MRNGKQVSYPEFASDAIWKKYGAASALVRRLNENVTNLMLLY